MSPNESSLASTKPIQKRRVAVFIDYQNCYRAAREAFFDDQSDPSWMGQFFPHMLANLLASKDGLAYTLTFVGVYAGIAANSREPKTFAARRKQVAIWEKTGVKVFTRRLQYPRAWPKEKAHEKGVDVKLAIDLVMKAIWDEFDVGIVASCDTDLTPAVEAVLATRERSEKPEVEVIAWKGRDNKIGVSGVALTYRWIGDKDFNAIRDGTDYNV
jgi:uncharacterized LabA/DUF88 family protein